MKIGWVSNNTKYSPPIYFWPHFVKNIREITKNLDFLLSKNKTVLWNFYDEVGCTCVWKTTGRKISNLMHTYTDFNVPI